MKWIMLVILAVVLGIGGVIFLKYVNYSNQEVSLRNEAGAQQKVNETIFDKMWKIISGKAGVSKEYAKEFKTIYVDLMKARYEGKDPMMNWIQEKNPDFDASLYKEVQRAIEAGRTEFQVCQQRLIDIKLQHDNLRTKIPSCWFIGGRPALDIKIVTSSKTEAAFNSGKEDDGVNPFETK